MGIFNNFVIILNTSIVKLSVGGYVAINGFISVSNTSIVKQQNMT
ncbi:MAG: hypothetical protein ACRC6K_05630 [Fusobacteriaceae bacterium]